MPADDHETMFRRWIQNHLGLMIKIVRSFTEAKADQEDLLQEIFVNLWTSMANFRGDSKESA